MDSKISWFGIDFGTTNSAAFSFTGAQKDDFFPIHYGDDEGRPFPSIVAINKSTGEVITGREAKDKKNFLLETHEYFSSIKSILDEDCTWKFAGKVWTPEDIASEIFLALKKRIEKGNDNIIDEAIVAIPIGFSSVKKGHLRNAANKAGIKIKMFISEPTAAFCSNYSQLKHCKNIAVFDWGGGTLDVAVINVESGHVRELATSGMSFAGDDIDRKLAEKMHVRFSKGKTPIIAFDDLDPITKDQLLTKCEKAKCDFEDEEVVSISINKYATFGAVRDSIEYDYFSLLIENDINNALNCLNEAISKAGLNNASIDCILCVGGSSNLRPLQDKLNEIYGEELVYYPEKVMWDIAKGAAITSTRHDGYKLSKSIGMILSDGSFFPLLHEGQKIPCEEFTMTLGIVQHNENGKSEARFIFTDDQNVERREFTHNFVVPLRGLMDESVLLSCYVDPDNVFKLKVGTNRMLEHSFKVWVYDNLKVSFCIEE